MSNIRTFSYLHNGDYIAYNNKIYIIDRRLTNDDNVIHVKTNTCGYVDEHEKVKWLKNFHLFKVIK